MSEWPSEWTRAVQQALAAPFDDEEIEFLPKASTNGKALALAYVRSRSVMQRLDSAVGPPNWSFAYDVIGDKSVRGILTVLGKTSMDAGEAKAEEEPLKSAVSDALKRCAVMFGIGRYLYRLPQVWAPYDAQKRRFTERPQISRGAIDHALRMCGYDVPESRGDQWANGPGPAQVRSVWSVQREASEAPVKPSPPPRVEEAVRSNEQAETFAGAAGAKAHDPRGAWHGVVDRHWKPAAERTEEGQRLRHAIAALLAGKSAPFESMTGWDERKWSALSERARAHEEQCADEVCRVMTAARAMVNAQLEAAGHAR